LEAFFLERVLFAFALFLWLEMSFDMLPCFPLLLLLLPALFSLFRRWRAGGPSLLWMLWRALLLLVGFPFEGGTNEGPKAEWVLDDDDDTLPFWLLFASIAIIFANDGDTDKSL
jgi:hypothetical protein